MPAPGKPARRRRVRKRARDTPTPPPVRSHTAPPPPVAAHLPGPGRALPAWAPGVAVAVAAIVAYLPVLRAGFVWDDDSYVTANAALRTLDGLRRIWLEPGAVAQYYPLTFTTLWLEYRAWGLAPLGYHLSNVLLHALASVLLWRVLLRLDVPGAALGAALFALHPVHVESVAWVTERKNVLSGVFYLGAALAYLRWALPRACEPPAGWRMYAAALGCFVAALLAKTVTCTLPVALLVVVWWKRGRLRAADILPLAPVLVAGIAAGLGTAWLERMHVGARGAAWDLSLADRILIAGRAVWFYLWSLVWPVRLTFIYPRWTIDAGVWWQWVFPLAALAALGGLWAARGRIGLGPFVAALFFGITLGPALGFVDVYPMRYSFVADHFQYLASIGPLALAAALATRVRWQERRLAAGAVLALLAVLTWRQTLAYADAETLWRDTLAKNPGATMAHVNLGVLLQQAGRLDEAAAAFERALVLEPDAADGHLNLANVRHAQGRTAEAEAGFRAALRLDPGNAAAHLNLANTLAARGALADAVPLYERALALRPRYADAHNNLANVLAMQGRTEEAVPHWEAALAIDPGYAEAHRNLALVLANAGRLAEAEARLREAVRLKPDFAAARGDLDRVRAAQAAAAPR